MRIVVVTVVTSYAGPLRDINTFAPGSTLRSVRERIRPHTQEIRTENTQRTKKNSS
ncbi:hypothetical protein P7K49_020783 [Saguinus oedipus]|uniref:Uncharacterized protein n=1 Tax=Saguinus oedipus TaxID=9490 RepID=A0ABQ9URP6_SAGOE|nr:hypothetical protein P7K49_020783 [Saguinus oedipus]